VLPLREEAGVGAPNSHPPLQTGGTLKLEVKMTNYPPGLHDSDKKAWEDSTVTECINRGVKRFPTPLPSIFDFNDQMSAFLLGITWGLNRVDWHRGDPIEYLVAKGIWTLRTYRYRAMGKNIRFYCTTCGKELKIGEIACHRSDGEPTPANAYQAKRDWRDTIDGQDPERRAQMDDGRTVIVAELATDVIEQYAEDAMQSAKARHNGEPIGKSVFDSV
jgi:hypothetical protein